MIRHFGHKILSNNHVSMVCVNSYFDVGIIGLQNLLAPHAPSCFYDSPFPMKQTFGFLIQNNTSCLFQLNKRQQEERLAAEKAAAEKSNKTTPDESNEAEPDSIGSVESGVHEQSADSGAAPNEPEVESAHASEIMHGTGEQDSSNIERPPEDSGCFSLSSGS